MAKNFYRSINPQFWSGKTGKALRGNPEAQLLALYLVTNQHTTMEGVYHLPIAYICADTGLSVEGATKGLARLYEAGFCEYFDEVEVVFVYKMLTYQSGNLKSTDNRTIAVRKFYDQLEESVIKQRFAEIYWELLGMESKPLASPLQAPRVSVAVTETVTETVTVEGAQKAEEQTPPAAPKVRPKKTATRLDDTWQLPDEYAQWCRENRPDLNPYTVADQFKDYWIAQPGAKARKQDWFATWRNWCRNQRAINSQPTWVQQRTAWLDDVTGKASTDYIDMDTDQPQLRMVK